MNRQWIQSFYCECGREVSLASNTLNDTNTWGVTLTVALLGAGALKAIEVKDGHVSVAYPTIVHWFLAIVAWIVMVRFFVRSCLALTNMHRWNALIRGASKILSLPEGHGNLPVFERNFAKQLKAYYYDWRSPIPRTKIIWDSLKLMYLWFFVILLALILWGAFILVRDWLYMAGLSLLIVPTVLELIWFRRWYGFEYTPLDLEEEPEITVLWQPMREEVEEESAE